MTEILIPGREAFDSEVSKGPRSFGNLAEKSGWTLFYGYSKFYEPPGVYGPNAKKAGESYGEKTVDHVWIEAVHPTRLVRFLAFWHNGSFEDAVWNNQYKVNSLVLRQLIDGTITEPSQYVKTKKGA